MPRYKLTIEYDGTDFCGWQKQEPMPEAAVSPGKVLEPGAAGGRSKLRTVQEVLERAVREVVREPVVVMGASRTDAGVHARGQVAAFTCGGEEKAQSSNPQSSNEERGPEVDVGAERSRGGWPLDRGTDRLVLAVNSRLPDDVLVVGAEPAPANFDPVRDCVSKGYSYSLFESPTRAMFERRYVHHLWTPLDVDAMKAAAERFVGEHDFAAFAAAGHGRLTTVRTIHECGVAGVPLLASLRAQQWPTTAAPQSGRAVAPQNISISVSGSGFLYNMVRIIAGTLVDVGRGRMTPDDVTAAIASKDRRRAGPTLPARGLCLEWVTYAAAAAAR